MDKIYDISNFLPEKIRERYLYFVQAGNQIEEIRMVVNQMLYFVCDSNILDSDLIITKTDIQEVMEYMTDYSLYSYENEIKEGYFTVKGGHRIGVAGKAIYEDGILKNVVDISAVNIRICHDINVDCDIKEIKKYMLNRNILIISSPGIGKTTLLREIVRIYSDEFNKKIVVIDERNEITGNYNGENIINVGKRTFVLSSYKKDTGINLAVRSLAPEYVAVDEIGSKEDFVAINNASNAGVNIIATIHGDNLEEVFERRELSAEVCENRFNLFVILHKRSGKRYIEIYDREHKRICWK